MKKVFLLLIISFLQLNCYSQILLTTARKVPLKSEPYLNSNNITEIQAHVNVELIDFLKERNYFKVKFNNSVGYLHQKHINYDDAYNVAIKVEKGNAYELYLKNKYKIDVSNKRKIYEENLWQKQNFKPATEIKSQTNISTNRLVKKTGKSSNDVVRVIDLKRNYFGMFEIPCKVNGLKLSFILDTGSSDVSISLAEALFMLKNGYLSEDDILGAEYYVIATGEIKEGTKIRIRKLEFEGLILYNIEASIVHNIKAPLLLGQSVFSRFGIIQIDYSNNTLTILKK